MDEESADQRLDNFLARILKGVPRSHLYRVLRTGEVRVNSRRVDATYRIQPGDQVRLPPIRTAQRAEPALAPLLPEVLFEDEALVAVNKPAGLAVHGGSGVSSGVIERFRRGRPEARFLELVHRLDRETSGVLLIAKKRSALRALHEALREGRVHKSYLALVAGTWTGGERTVDLPLLRTSPREGERHVLVHEDGKASATRFKPLAQGAAATLLEARLLTGRTHQIRVHLSHLGFPIAGDDRYGDFALNRGLRESGLRRMFLHAWRVSLRHPLDGTPLELRAPLPAELAGPLGLLCPAAGKLEL